MKTIQVLLLSFLLFTPVFSQSVSDWKNYTDKSNVADIAISGNYIWAATGGGAFGWNLTDSSFITLTKTEGLQTINLTAVTADIYGKIWFGSNNGIISVYDPANESIKSILDIYLSERTAKGINELNIQGDTILAATDFGISLIDSRTYNFYDTYFKFGDFTSFIAVNSVFKKGIYYLATQSGVAIQKPNTTNLSAPESWNVYRQAQGLPDNIVTGIVSYKDSIICATNNGLAVFNGISWEPFLSFITTPVTTLYSTSANPEQLLDDALYFTTNNVIYRYANGSVSDFFAAPSLKNKIRYFDNRGFYIATSLGVVEYSNFNGSNFVIPDGPRTNQFRDLAAGVDGALWIATGSDASGVGTNKFDGERWVNYNVSLFPEMVTNALYSVYIAPDNTKYFGTWGEGLVIYDGQQFVNYNAANAGLVGITGNTNFVVLTAVEQDSRGNTWVLNFGSAERKSLSMVTPDRQWFHFAVPAENNIYLEQHLELAVDHFDTKWYSVNSSSRQGLFYFNENKTYDNSADDKSGFITVDQGLSSNSITSLAVDRRGDVWVGTSLGLTIITNTNTVLTTAQLRYFPVYALRQQTIRCIAVDPLNNKWIGTNQGLLYVNSDGSSLLAAYDSKNSPLLTDEIRSLTIDASSGIVYAGTDAGLVSFKTDAVRPLDSFTELRIYPNPFKLNNSSQQITIDGLIKDSDIKILTISGKLIYEFSSSGGRVAHWDGKDFSGKQVSSGIYLVVAFDKEGNNVVTGKVAVLRE